MTKTLSFLLFLLVLTSLSFGAHYYFWVRFVRDMELPAPWPKVLTVLVGVLALVIPAAVGAMALVGRAPEPLLRFAYVWIGLCLLLLVTLALGDLARSMGGLAYRAARGPSSEVNEARRLFWSRLFGVGALATAGGLAAYATRAGLGSVPIKRVRVPLTKMPHQLSGFRVVQLSDIHVGPSIGRDFVETIVQQVNALKPDMVAITGDLVDGSVSTLEHAVAPLKDIEARHGVFFVTGNHEYYSGAEEWCRHLETLDIKVLRNTRVTIEQGQHALDVAGVDDYSSSRHREGPFADVAEACRDRNPERPLVLLAHQPRHVTAAQDHQVCLQLSGHTHGGQLWPWNYLVALTQPLLTGLAQFGSTWLYVSNGTGYWGPPMRLGAPAEITEITLVAV